MAQELYSAGIALPKTARFLRTLQEELPAESYAPARLSAVGNELAVREGGTLRNAEGQYLFDFSAQWSAGVAVLDGRTDGSLNAEQWYCEAQRIEESDPLGALSAYREALSLDPEFENAYVNLGHLLIENGQALEACIVLDEAVAHCADSALIHFNLAIAREDLGRNWEAIVSYERAIRCDSGFADAHFNLARLYEQVGDARKAIRHLNAYRRLGGASER
jgi:tetratricopeptide (TPR) repeat protein